MRFSSIIFGAIVEIAAIQPKWVIDEKAIILRSWVWLSPPHPPSVVDSSPIIRRAVVDSWFEVRNIRAMGASFCQVVIIMATMKVVPWSTSGNQKCNGASPSFIAKAIVIVMHAGL